MNQCEECKRGTGGDDGVGGTVKTQYGDPKAQQPDHSVFGHVRQYEYKLKACSSLVIQRVGAHENGDKEAGTRMSRDGKTQTST